uniref:Uncharacterized protein n=1 Tax=Chromera velia CCMP2878 TaxID=1169474 RepID=A0A0G4HZM0_9ALVE|eukprot:Cvel_9755.t1-p1 / transcript=Cvel_9755.t1 / gene=Cvel_9755 / organism=Chromera_velia_CCMP2878 / gene_product=hypothetical protein / transcript_product=hypothetical protein / location=Cvel_scaffold571:6472-8655(+) / protein_length=544 / sequence_SO=supercontig / SO=protein_coding / is_pseudo=false
MYRVLGFSALFGTALPGVSGAWLKEHPLPDDNAPTFLQQRRSFTHSLGDTPHHQFTAYSNKTNTYIDDPKTLDLKVNVLNREQTSKGEVKLSHDVANYGFSFFFVGNPDDYTSALDTTLQKFKAAQGTMQFRAARDWANENLFPHIADMITNMVDGVDAVSLIGSDLWQDNAERVWDDTEGKKFIESRSEGWNEYNAPKWRRNKRLSAATVFRNVLDQTCYGHPCGDERPKKDDPHKITCPKKTSNGGGCSDDLCCKPKPNVMMRKFKKMQEMCGIGDEVLIPQSCAIDGSNPAKSFPALHVDHFHSVTLELDFGFMGIMDMQSKQLSDTPVYFYKGTERKGYPATYRLGGIYNAWVVLSDELCGKPLSVLDKPRANWNSVNDITQYPNEHADEVTISPLNKGDFIFFETLKTMHGALPVVDDDHDRCPSKCRNSIEFRFITLEERVFPLMDEHDKQLMHTPEENDDVELEQTPEDVLSMKKEEQSDDKTVQTGTGNDDQSNVDFAEMSSSRLAHTHHAHAVAHQKKRMEKKPPTEASEILASE